MQTVAETPMFVRQAAELFTEEEHKEMIDFLAANPQVETKSPALVESGNFGLRRKAKESVVGRA